MKSNSAVSVFIQYALFVAVLAVAGFGLYHARSGGDSQSRQLLAQAVVDPTTESAKSESSTGVTVSPTQASVVAPVLVPVTHQSIPEHVRGIYISSWSAGSKRAMTHLYNILDTTSINTVVVDIKDATGMLSYKPKDLALLASGVGTNRIADLPALIATLHSKHVYVIGRIAVFQDPYYAPLHLDDAYADTATGKVWVDAKGIAWLRPDSEHVWNYVSSIAEDAYAQGFDEINLDYVRFPTDGKLSSIDLSWMKGVPRQTIIQNFFIHMDATIRQKDHIPLSADIFGLTLSTNNDMGIGQQLNLIAPHVDYVDPMIYPSHFGDGTYGIKKPAEHPYEMINTSLNDGIKKLATVQIAPEKLRPWLQDFNLGAVYTPDMITVQIKATNDAGLQSWIFWDPKNIYTSSAF